MMRVRDVALLTQAMPPVLATSVARTEAPVARADQLDQLESCVNWSFLAAGLALALVARTQLLRRFIPLIRFVPLLHTYGKSKSKARPGRARGSTRVTPHLRRPRLGRPYGCLLYSRRCSWRLRAVVARLEWVF